MKTKRSIHDSKKDVSLVKYGVKWFSIVDLACRFSNTMKEYPWDAEIQNRHKEHDGVWCGALLPEATIFQEILTDR